MSKKTDLYQELSDNLDWIRMNRSESIDDILDAQIADQMEKERFGEMFVVEYTKQGFFFAKIHSEKKAEE